MRKTLVRFVYLFFAILSILGEIALIKSFAPNADLSFSIVKLPVIPLFFLLLFLIIFSLIVFFFRSKLQGVLIGVFVCFYLLFRSAGLVRPLYQILLVLIFISVELFFWQKKKEIKKTE